MAVASLSVLSAEVALSRVFSVLFRAPYVFLVISGAIGGLGLGGLLVHLARPDARRVERQLPAWLLALSLATALPLLLLLGTPPGREMVSGAETLVVVVVPLLGFTAAGALLGLVFRTYRESGGILYAADLAAAGLGAPLAVLLLDWVGAVNTPLVVAHGTSLLAVASAYRMRLGLLTALSGATALVLSIVYVGNAAGRRLDLPRLRVPAAAVGNPSHPWHATTKPLFAELADPYSSARIVRTDWSAVSRTDVVHDRSQDLYYVYTDGDVPTQMEPWDGDLGTARRQYAEFIGMFPFRLLGRPPREVMAIGAGGGLDVLLALSYGAGRVDAVEINPSLRGIVRDPRFQHTYARVYADPRVRLIVDEGRSYLQRAGRYDLIYFACAKTATTQTSGIALLDNHLYTEEAFIDYWRHLSDQGLLALVTQEAHLIDRLLLTATSALGKVGVSSAGEHLLTARVPEARFGLGPYRHLLVMSRRTMTGVSVETLSAALRRNALEPLFVPGLRSRGAAGAEIDLKSPLETLRTGLESQYPIPGPGGRSQNAWLAPVTDDRPFYVDVARGLHPNLRQILIGATVASAAIFALPLVFGARRALRERAGAGRSLFAACCYFALLGAGFMLAEVALLQKLLLILGFPTRSLTVTLFTLLLAGAAGSRMAQRTPEDRVLRRLTPALLALAGLLVLIGPLVDRVGQALLPHALPIRVLGVVAVLIPLGLLAGRAFPSAVRGLDARWAGMIPLFWAVNGVTSVLGSVLAMVVARSHGYSAALLLAAGLYGAAALLGPLLGGPGGTQGEPNGVGKAA